MVRTPVVVELFTSEGCSSCPPAELCCPLSEGQVTGNIQWIALEEPSIIERFGLDRPFSSGNSAELRRAWNGSCERSTTTRTRANGCGRDREFGGSRNSKPRFDSKAAGKTKIPVCGTGRADGMGKEFIREGRQAGRTTKGEPRKWAAITKRGCHSSVTRGENAGEDLHHAAVGASCVKSRSKGEANLFRWRRECPATEEGSART